MEKMPLNIYTQCVRESTKQRLQLKIQLKKITHQLSNCIQISKQWAIQQNEALNDIKELKNLIV